MRETAISSRNDTSMKNKEIHSMSMPRPEYPRPQFVRREWQCLNGEWQFEIDPGNSGLERGLLERELREKIVVPFCPESELSGIGNTDFLNAVWYRRDIEIPKEWAGKETILHFQAVDYDTTVWCNGVKMTTHRGGFTPFEVNLSRVVSAGETATVVVRAQDDHRLRTPKGKQCAKYANEGCLYTRTTGIWQTVWMEPVPGVRLKRPRITPDLANRRFRIDVPVTANAAGPRVKASLKLDGQVIAEAAVSANSDFTPQLDLVIPEDKVKLWDVGQGNLYDIDLVLIDSQGRTVDEAATYAGLRSITISGRAFLLNGRKVFQRQVLDQGYYPDGILTAPSDQALLRDIELSLAAGFNSARLHQKVFEERFLYHADRLGYMVWGEFADWCHYTAPDSKPEYSAFLSQWLEVLHRDYSHPCIIGWCPMNETSRPDSDFVDGHDSWQRAAFLATKAMDTTRPVLDTSGYVHRVPETDVYDCHDYCQDPVKFRQTHAGLASDEPMRQGDSVAYAGQPYFVSEFGGIWWNPGAAAEEQSWGYGDRPTSIDEFYERFEALCNVLLDNPEMFGYCYTQLTDVYQEQNGIVSFDRQLKFDMDRLRAIQTRPAAFEQ
jgi:beta-galactosidase/beta-glucuronidase